MAARRATLIAILVCATAAPARAQAPECIGLEVQPARVTSDLESRVHYEVTVRNCTDEALIVTASVTQLGHDLDGQPEFFDSSAAEGAMDVRGLGRFRLGPGRTARLPVTATIPDGARSLYAGVVAEFERPDADEGSSVQSRSRVAAMLLMRGPKPWVETAEIVEVGLEEIGEGRYRVHAIIEDTGDVHIEPTGTMQIRHVGRVVDEVELDGGIILPGFKRRLAGVWTPDRAPDGRYRLTVDTPYGSASTVVDLTDGDVLAPSGRIDQLVASDAEGAYIAATVRNTGGVELDPHMQFIVTEGEFERARVNLPLDEPLAPGAAAVVEWEPELADGTYEVRARLLADGTLLDEKVTGLRIGAAAAGGSGWLIVVAGLLLLLVLGGLLFVLWRRRRRDDSDDAPPPGSVRAGRLRTRVRAGIR